VLESSSNPLAPARYDASRIQQLGIDPGQARQRLRIQPIVLLTALPDQPYLARIGVGKNSETSPVCSQFLLPSVFFLNLSALCRKGRREDSIFESARDFETKLRAYSLLFHGLPSEKGSNRSNR